MHATQANPGFLKRVFVQPVQRFIQMEASGGILLLLCAVAAIIWANSPFAAAYFHLWETHIAIELGHSMVSMHLMHWINDGLMAIFFFMVGLEIKREMLSGELASPKKAALPIAGAIGGMIVPAVLYAAFNAGTASAGGWGIPMATDIAFALGVVILLGKRVPLALKVFLTALAIVDDLGAVLVIAFFYTSDLNFISLGIGAAFLVALIAINRMGVRRPAPYVMLGIGLWVAFLQSGVHATISGVLLALTIPASRKMGAYAFMAVSRDLAYKYMGLTEPNQRDLKHDQAHVVHEIEHACKDVSSPLVRMEHALHGWVNFLIMPLFAFANAGVRFVGTDITAALTSHVTIGVIVGLFVGKQIGVSLFSWLSIRLGLAEMPSGTTWRQFYGVSLLAGIGFTMSLFVSNLAFTEAAMLDSAKMGILLASTIAGVAGWIALSRSAATAPALDAPAAVPAAPKTRTQPAPVESAAPAPAPAQVATEKEPSYVNA
ncbi:MAG: Na+/H+ antiporter NhaA [Rhodothermales bacterium]